MRPFNSNGWPVGLGALVELWFRAAARPRNRQLFPIEDTAARDYFLWSKRSPTRRAPRIPVRDCRTTEHGEGEARSDTRAATNSVSGLTGLSAGGR
jgi:hypothetical protein